MQNNEAPYAVYWDDLKPGDEHNFGSYHITADDIIEFGVKYDPLPHHVSELTAAKSPMRKLCASGIQALGIAHKILCDNLLSNSSLVAGKGFESMRVHKPILPAQKLHIKMMVLSATDHPAKKDRGWVHYKVHLLNCLNERLMTYSAEVLFLKRPLEKQAP